MNLVDKIMAYEATLEFFQKLVDDGLAFQLQGHYGRTAARLIEAGLVRPGRKDK